MKRKVNFLPLAVAVGCAVMVIAFPSVAVSGVKDGLKICGGVVIPSLFPLMIISNFIAYLPLNNRLVSRLTEKAFRLPSCCAPAILLGLVGGFPVGCMIAARLLESKRINSEQAGRLACFCVNGGPAFVITAVGLMMLGSVKIGLIMFVSLCTSALIIGVCLRFTAPCVESRSKGEECFIGTAQALVLSTESACNSMLNICAWVTVFACIGSYIKSSGISEGMNVAVNCLLEVTAGCRAASQVGNIYAVVASLGWGGVCVGCQVAGSLKKIGVKMPVYFAFRALNGALAAGICALLFKLFPIEAQVFSNFAAARPVGFAVSVPATLSLIGLCIVFVIDLDRNKKLC